MSTFPVPVKGVLVHDYAYPSTRTFPDAVTKLIADHLHGPDYSALYLKCFDQQRGEWDRRDDLLDPPDSYPFVEYGDLTAQNREMLLTLRCGWWIERNSLVLEDHPMKALAERIHYLAKDESADQWDVTRDVSVSLQEAWESSEVIRKAEQSMTANGPQPARKGHLMAEGGAYAKARAMKQDGNRYQRKVTFSEPVNAFTMLYGDSIAKGGDMLTSVTLTDSEEYEIKDVSGRVSKRYSCWAVNL